MTIKAIETQYKGYRFRSRLEARWAVFLDNAHTEWDYEVEGFDLPSGRYLPDFYLRDKAYLEIKPGPPPAHIDDGNLPREIQLLKELHQMTGKSVFIVYGDPMEAFAPGYPGLFSYETTEDEGCCWNFTYYSEYAAPIARRARFEFGETPA